MRPCSSWETSIEAASSRRSLGRWSSSSLTRVAGFVTNKFRGDVRLLDSGLRFLEERTGVPVLGVLPYVPKLRVADEDSLALDDRRGRARAREGELEIAVVRLPRISN